MKLSRTLLMPFFTFALIASTPALLAGCDDQGPAEEAGENIDNAAEETGEAAGDAADEAGDAVDRTTD